MELKKCEKLARELMTVHGLTDWGFQFDRSKRRFGQCDHGKKMISMSWRLVKLNTEETVKSTILHELAHALVDRKHGHNDVWRAKSIEIGGGSERCYSLANTIVPKRTKRKFKTYRGTCPKCGRVIIRTRRIACSCSKCDKKFNKDLLFIWSAHD